MRAAPCGKCAQCAKKTQNDWYIRIFEESKNWDSSLFFTLTYNEESVPLTSDNKGNIYNSVCRDDIQLWMKRLRKSLCSKYGDSFRIKYFLCAEYGPKTFRPHYHGILFGLNKADIKLIEKSWNKGFINVSKVRSAGSFRYVSKYCAKPAVLKYERNHPVEKTFRLVSHGLGKSYCLNSATLQFHKSDIFGHHYYYSNGFKYGLPRYYTLKMFTNQENLEYKRLKELQALKDWRFRFSSRDDLCGKRIYVQSDYQAYLSREADYIDNHKCDGADMMLFQKFQSKSIF